jgi:hypothetical protein
MELLDAGKLIFSVSGLVSFSAKEEHLGTISPLTVVQSMKALFT